MITSRIASGFDVELQLGSGWFHTAVNVLNDAGLLAPPGLPVIITDVQITFEPGWDLRIDVLGFDIPVFARVQLDGSGAELILTTNIPMIPEMRIPFGALRNLAGTPVLVKLAGDDDHDAVLAVLANMNIQSGPQNEEPMPEGEFLPRGDALDAQSFLPSGQSIAFGMSKHSFRRFGNNIWHTSLRNAADGTHPLPNAEAKKGEWSKVTMKPENGRVRITLEGDVPVDSPWIDVIPDPHVTITLLLTPALSDGRLSFRIETETDVDTGLLGDLLAGISGGIAGAIIGLLVGLVTGAILPAVLLVAGVGIVVGVIALEIAEVVIEGIVQTQIRAMLDGEPLAELHCNRDGIVQIARPASDAAAFNLSVLDSIPASIPIHTDNPDDELLYKRSLLVTAHYDELLLDAEGFAVAGTSGKAEKYQPEVVNLVAVEYEDERLTSLVYRRTDGRLQELSIEEVLDRAADGELRPPFRLFREPEDAMFRIGEGRLACVCLRPVRIRQDDTVVAEIEFEGGLRIRVQDAIALQDAGALVVLGYQLIHPRDYNAYYRAKADFYRDNNFESLPTYENA